jgi:hypothetical protein
LRTQHWTGSEVIVYHLQAENLESFRLVPAVLGCLDPKSLVANSALMGSDATNRDRQYRRAPKGGVVFQSGTRTGAVFWGVVVVEFGAAGSLASGIAG